MSVLAPPGLHQPAAQPAADPMAVLRVYDGAWRVRAGAGKEAAKPADRLVNRCVRATRYFACEQTVNDTVRVLLVFAPADSAGRALPGRFVTQGVTPDGHAIGRGTLAVDGARWTYLGEDRGADGRATYYRTVNVFDGPDHIRYELARSTDGTHWTVTGGGEEERAPGAPATGGQGAGPPPA